MRLQVIRRVLPAWCAAAVVLCTAAGAQTMAGQLKYQALLIWGTDDAKPPDDKPYKPVDPQLKKKLQDDIPLRWKNYFEMSRTNFTVAPGGSQKVAISGKCELELKVVSASGSEIEVVVIGKQKQKEAARQKRALRPGEMMVLGGNSPNATSWLVVVKRIE